MMMYVNDANDENGDCRMNKGNMMMLNIIVTVKVTTTIRLDDDW